MRLTLIIIFIFCVKTISAQTCTGSVGDPIVNVTFGAGATIGPALQPGTTTNLTYYANDCPNDGYYTIINRTANCFGDSWHTLTDHTGDPNGYFMLVNASYAPSSFYVQNIDGLCSGTTYQFAVWIVNMCTSLQSILPNITLDIEKTDGTILDSFSTGDIPVTTGTAVWQQYGFNFTMPVGVSNVVLRMKNNAPGGNGNDIALDDITFRPIGPRITLFSSDFSGDTAYLCDNSSKRITFHSTIETCYAATSYQWQLSIDGGNSWADVAGASSESYVFIPTTAGTYQYRVTVAQQNDIGISLCRVASQQFTVIVYGNNVRTIAITKPDGAICQDEPVTFKATTSYAGSNPYFQWMLNNKPISEANDSTFTTNNLASGDRIDCYFASSFPCNQPLTSNIIPVTVLTKARTTVTVSICEGEKYEGYSASGVYSDSFPGSNGCDSIRTVNLTVYPKEHTIFDTSICYGATYSGLNKEGAYDFTYQSIHGCDSVQTIRLHVLPDYNARPYVDTVLCTGDSIVYSPGVFDNYKWQDGATASSYTIVHGGNYQVSFTSKCGTFVRNITINERICTVGFPTAFTPNGDGRNDIFKVLNGYDVSQYHCVIFNRWGQIVFESSDPQRGWDGTINGRQADIGVYLWFCNYTSKTKPGGNASLKGTVLLMR